MMVMVANVVDMVMVVVAAMSADLVMMTQITSRTCSMMVLAVMGG